MFYRVLFISLLLGCSDMRAGQDSINEATKKVRSNNSTNYNFVWPFIIGAGSAALGFWLWDRYPSSPVGPIIGVSGVGFAYDAWRTNQRSSEIKREEKKIKKK